MNKNLNIPRSELAEDFACSTMQAEDEKGAGKVVRPHRHNFYTVIWCQKARGLHQIDFKDYELQNNMIFFVSPEQVHCLSVEPGPKGFVFLFTDYFLEKNGLQNNMINALGLFSGCEPARPLYLGEIDTERLEKISSEIINEYQSGKDFRFEAIGALLKLFMLECYRLKELSQPNKPEEAVALGNRISREFHETLSEHYMKFHKVSDYAGLLHITPNYLNEVIKSETGRSAKELIQDRIILEAKRFATHSNLTLKEIAYNLGFDDPAHFSKFFKKCVGKDFSGFREVVKSGILAPKAASTEKAFVVQT